MADLPDWPPAPVLKPGPAINTGQVLQSADGVNPLNAIQNQSGPFEGGIATSRLYADSGPGNIFHLSSYTENTGSRPTVSVFGGSKGSHAFGGNFVAYTNGSGNAIGVEVDFGNVDPGGGTGYGLVLKGVGGNVGGAPNLSGAFIQMQARDASQPGYGLKFNIGSGVQPVDPTGTLISAFGIVANAGLDFRNAVFTAGAIRLGDSDIEIGSTRGAMIGTAADQKVALRGKTPIQMPSVTTLAALVRATVDQGIVSDTSTAPLGLADLQAREFRPSFWPKGCTFVDPSLAGSNLAVPASGQVYAAKMPLVQGEVLTGLGALCSSIGTGVTHLWYLLLDSSRTVLAVTADIVASMVAGSPLSADFAGGPVTIPADGSYYACWLATWTTAAPGFRGLTSHTSITGLTSIRAGTSTGGFTTSPPNVGDVLAALTPVASILIGGAY